MPKPSQINPPTPVWNTAIKKELADKLVPFEITRVSSFKSPKFGPTWRVHITRLDNRDSGILLLAANDVRDDAMGAFKSAIEEDGEAVGPCNLSAHPLASGNDTWEIVDASDTAQEEKSAKK